MASIRDLFVTIGVKADIKDVEKLNQSLKTVGKVAKWAGVAIAGAMAGASAWAVKLAADFEQTEIAFETMLGSGEKAKALIADLRKFSTTESPFNFLETTKHAKKLLAYGVSADEMIGTIRMLGNIAAGVGKDKLPFLTLAFGQIKAKGVLAGQELRQLTETGVPIIEALSKQTGFSTAQITDQTKDLGITFKQVEEALKGMTTEGGRFAGLMKKQTETFSGQLSIVRDLAEEIGTAFGKDLLKSLKPIVVSLREWLEVNKELIKLNLKGWAESFGSTLDWVKQNADKLRFAFTFLSIALAGIVAAKTAGAVLTFLSTITTAMIASAAATAINIAMWVALGALFAALVLTMEDLYVYFAGGKSLFGEMAKHNPTLKTTLGVLGKIGKVIAGIAVLVTQGDFGLIAEAFDEISESIRNTEFYLQKLKPLAEFLYDLLSGEYYNSISKKLMNFNMGSFFGSASGNDYTPTGNTTTSNITNKPNININVNGGDYNAEELATLVVEKQKEAYASSYEDF
jgi:tape measure domain-containing protein